MDLHAQYHRWCPINPLHCDDADTGAAVVEHLLRDHDPRVVAEHLVRAAYMLSIVEDRLERLLPDAERMADGLVPRRDEGADVVYEIHFETKGDSVNTEGS